MSLEAFRRIQIGLEGTRGTAVAADTIMIGNLSLTPSMNIHRPTDERNSLAEFKRSVVTRHGATLRYTADATFEQILQFLSMTLKGGITATTPTGGTLPRDWAFTPSLTAVNTQDSFTFEYGDNTQAWETAFTVCSSMELGISMGEVLSLNADLFARQPQKVSFTGSLTDPTVNEILCDGAKFFVDTTWANVGSTEFNAMLAGGTVRLNSGLTPVRYADGLDAQGEANFSTVSEGRRSHSMDLDLIVSSNFIAQAYDAWEAQTNRSIRVVFDLADDSIESSFNHELEIDMFGHFIAEPELFGERDGEDMVRMSFQSADDGLGNELSVRVRTGTTAI